MTIKGYDVSNYQSTEYSTSGIDFVVVKATEGTSYTNPKRAAQVKRGRDAGLVVGHYHFVNGNSSMKAQVDYFLAVAAPKAGEFLALDWENPSVSSAEKDAFLSYLKSRVGSRKVLLYCNVDYWKNHDVSSKAADGLWIAAYNGHPGQPGIQASWLMHQYTSTPIDTSIANFDSRAKMAAWAGAAPVKPPEKLHVSVAHLIAARKKDLPAKTGHTTYKAEVMAVEKALHVLGYFKDASLVDGSWGSKTDDAYNAYRRHEGYKGKAAEGDPGIESLSKLAHDAGTFVAAH
ncbi:glycoside hydrolase family 25 protein [Streptomyces sp. MI02-2A]|uniref:glycoside hydrolase family 25 protein n=1 Tax=Streptomyces sp. MI02-2A TaxID=3028688 RepID=UPI0029BEB766|nr:glycoside hydrolase family 25 protein [Streptomyces sp. MI02-2A]MDX3260748.1 glycoside hydrolase family 25 protein [Streptomyces sp. MI02-2A]